MQAARYDIQILFSSIFNYIFTPLLRMTKLVSRRIKCLCNVTTKNLFYVSRFLPLIWNKEMKKNLDSLQTWMWKAFLRLPMKVFILYEDATKQIIEIFVENSRRNLQKKIRAFRRLCDVYVCAKYQAWPTKQQHEYNMKLLPLVRTHLSVK